MYEHVQLENVESHDVDGQDPIVRSVGYELQPTDMRPSVWEYEAGETNAFHRQDAQEELYVVLEGRFDVTIERDGERDVVELREDEFLLVPPSSWRRLEALEPSTVLVVGAPNVKDDAIVDE